MTSADDRSGQKFIIATSNQMPSRDASNGLTSTPESHTQLDLRRAAS